jgi:hypothetical protein
MTPDTTALRERLRERASSVLVEPEDSDLMRQGASALLSSAEVREEAERERDELRLAITGGEDAPGHNASLSHETILGVLAENYRSWRAASDRWVAAETRAQQAEARVKELEKALKPFAEAAEVRPLRWDGEKMVEQVPQDRDTYPAGPLAWGHVRAARQALGASHG